MRTGGGKVAASRTMQSSVSVVRKTAGSVDGEDSRVEAGWDEEFFGHELPPNYKISVVRTRAPDVPDARKDTDVMERALWDEFLGHHLPPNYVISRLEMSEGREEKGRGGGGKRGGKDSRNQRPQHLLHHHQDAHSRSDRHYGSNDTFEYNIDPKGDGYVLSMSEIPQAGRKDATVGARGRGAARKLDGISTARSGKDDSGVGSRKGETFEERALRFGVEDWNLVGNKKWLQSECKGVSKRSSTRRGIFHSPSGSDTSSMISTLESSSFSCRSEGSSFAKTDFSSSSFNLSHVPGMSVLGSHPAGICTGRGALATREKEEDDEQFVELNILCKERLDDGCGAGGKDEEPKDGSNFLEFNFLDGKMVESDAAEERGSSARDGEMETESMKMGDSPSFQELAASPGGDGGSSASEMLHAPAQSPECENFFDSSQDSDWSETFSASTVDHHQDRMAACAAEMDAGDFGENGSNFTEDRCSDALYFDADPGFATPCNSNSAIMDNTHVRSDATEAAAASEPAKDSRLDDDSSSPACPDTKAANEERKSTGRSPKKLHCSTPRKTRSLGSVLSHHLAFTAVPSMHYKSQPSVPSEQKQNPSKVSAACIQWLWSEKEAMKPVRALQALAERENAERESIGSSPPVRNLDSAFKETSRVFSAGKPQSISNIRTPSSAESSQRISDSSPARSCAQQQGVGKESREAVLASWASIYGEKDSEGSTSSRVRRTSAPACKVSVAATPSLRHCHRGSLSPRKRPVNFVAQAGTRPGGSAKQPVPPKSLAVELEVLCRPFGPVLKGVRFLPTAKRGLGRPPLFSNLTTQLASTGSSSSSCSSASSTSSSSHIPAALKCGRLQCVVSRDGLPSYSLIMDDTNEIFAAKSMRLEAAGMYEGVSHVYTLHSSKAKGRGRTGWRQWGKREKPASDFAGNMTVTSTICPVVSGTGVQNYVESEFVLFDAKVNEIVSISCPASRTAPHSRSSFSTWDTATPQTSPQAGTASLYSSPTSSISLPSPSATFSTLGPANAAGATTPTKSVPSSRTVSLTLPPGSSASLDKGAASQYKNLEKHFSFTSPMHTGNIMWAGDLHERIAANSDVTDEGESQRWTNGSVSGRSQTRCEVAAVVVRTPLEKTQGKAATGGDKWGWGINFLRKSCDGARTGDSPDPARTPGNSPNPARTPENSPNPARTPGNSSSLKDATATGGACERSPTSAAAATLATPSPSPATSPSPSPAAGSGNGNGIPAAPQRCGSCGGSSTEEEPSSGHGLSITLVLPSGEHGCSANGVDGPQPLIERWRSGGKCDCGSWDLGCGLTIVANRKADNSDSMFGSKNQSNLQLYIEGKKHQTVGLALTPLMEGSYTLGFQAPIAPLHAFATAVAVLHSKDPILAAKRAGETKKRLTRIPVKVVPAAASRSFARVIEEHPSASRPLVSYKLVCPDPPASPFGRA